MADSRLSKSLAEGQCTKTSGGSEVEALANFRRRSSGGTGLDLQPVQAVPERPTTAGSRASRVKHRPRSPLPCYRSRPKSAAIPATPLPGMPQAGRSEWHDRAYWIPSPPITDRAEMRQTTKHKEPEWVFRPLTTKPRPTWTNRYNVDGSDANPVNHRTQRKYFDDLPTQKVNLAQTPAKPYIKNSAKTLRSSILRKNPGMVQDADGNLSPRRSANKPESAFELMQRRVSKLYEKLQDQPGMKTFADFYMWCIKKFKNLTRAWRLLDASLNMKLTYLEFLTSLREHDYKGDGRQIFKILDRDRSGSLSYFHFDPSGAMALANLCMWAEEKFGSVQNAFEKIDVDRNGKLTPEEFRKAAHENGLETDEPVSYLFQMIDLDANLMITRKEVAFLDAWACPPWLKVKADHEGCNTFVQNLVAKYRDNPILAWHHLDQNDQMRVSWDEFHIACKKLSLDAGKLAGVWRALDANLSGWVSLQEFSKEAYELLVKFKKWAEQKEGTIQKVFQQIDANSDGIVNRREFLVIRNDMDLTDDEYHTLYHGFDFDGRGVIKFSKLRYLDFWSIEEDLREEEFWNGISSCLTAKPESPAPSPRHNEETLKKVEDHTSHVDATDKHGSTNN